MQAAQHKTLFLAAMLILGVQPLAAHTHVAQNSRLGVDTFKTSLHQEIELGSSLKALEIDASVRRTCVRSRSAGKERDAETGLDYFGARYMSAAQGRFTSPDPKMFPDAVYDPQSWNKYGYVRNNPLRLVDPNGEDWKDVANGFMNAFNTNQVLGFGRTQDGNSDFRTGQAFGDAASTIQGVAEMLIGGGGEAGGLALDATGFGAIVGVPLNIASAGMIVHGTAVAGTGLKNLTGAALDPQNGTTVERRANDFTSGEKKKIDSRNAEQNGGVNICENCGRQVDKIQNKPGVPTPPNQLQRHQKKPAAQGGPGKADNGKVVCPECHLDEHRKRRQQQGQQ